MTNLEIQFRLADIRRRMFDACVTHKTEMRKLEGEIRQIQASCKHCGEWADRCPSCGKQKEVKS